MSLIFKEFRIVTPENIESYKKAKYEFKCVWCSDIFIEGDYYNRLMTNSAKPEDEHIGGNPTICKNCWDLYNGDELKLKQILQGRYKEYMDERLWWFRNK